MSDQHMTAGEKNTENWRKLVKDMGYPPLLSATTKEVLSTESILMEAERLTNGDRADDYGSYAEESIRIAAMWSQILGHEVHPRLVPLCMIALKICREVNKPKRDNIVDMAGYANCADKAITEFGLREQ